MNREIIIEAIECAIAYNATIGLHELAAEYQQALQDFRNSLPQFAVVAKTITSAYNAFVGAANDEEIPSLLTLNHVDRIFSSIRQAVIEKEIEKPLRDEFDDKGVLHSVYWQQQYDIIKARLDKEKEEVPNG